MAKRIQAGERANGNNDFWGFVWEGAPSEALTCNALEWQVSEGGGTILDEQGKVTVNNPHAIRAWSMAAHWVGSISPPGVTAYKEWDAFNLWQAGKAAFMRNWTNAYVAARAENSPTKATLTWLPCRGAARASQQLWVETATVSRAIRVIRGRLQCWSAFWPAPRSKPAASSGEPPTVPALYKNADVLAANPYLSRFLQVFAKGRYCGHLCRRAKCIRRFRARIMKRYMPCLLKGRARQMRQATCKSN